MSRSIIVVTFDNDEDDDGTLPQRHIPARFVTLVPHEFPASRTKKKRKSAATSDAPKKRPAPPVPAKQESSVDDMLLGMYGYGSNAGSSDLNYDELVFSTPNTTPPPGASKKQRDDLAASHFG